MKTFLSNLGLSLLAILAPIHSMLIAAFVLSAADLILGVWAAIKQKQKISSAGLRRTVSKIFVYEVAIILAFVAQKFLLKDSIEVVNIVAGFIGLVEIKSCLENLNIISGKDLLKEALVKLGSKNQE